MSSKVVRKGTLLELGGYSQDRLYWEHREPLGISILWCDRPLRMLKRYSASLTDFGFGSLGLAETDFTTTEQVVQLGLPPVRIDLLTSISGVTWSEADKNAVAGKYGTVEVQYLGKTEFIANKRACGRPQDIADIAALEGE